MALFATTNLLPAPDLEVDMYTQLSEAPQWLATKPLPMSSSLLNSAGCYQSAPQSSSPLQLSSPCTPCGSAGSMLSGFSSMSCGNFPFYGQQPMNGCQPLTDDYSQYNMPYQPTTSCPFLNYGPTPEGNIGRLISQLSSCLKQVAGKDIDISRGIWENYLQEFFDDGALFFVEIDGCGEKQRYVLNRENLPGYFHTFSEDGVCNLQHILGEVQIKKFQELFRLNYNSATCIVDYTKPCSVKVISEGRLLVDMKSDDNFKITLWYFKVHKYNEFIQRSSILTKDDIGEIKMLSQNISTCGLPGATYSYLKKHGMYKVDSLDDVLLSPVPSKMTPTSLVAPVANSDWLPDPYTAGYRGTYTTCSNMYSRVSSLPNYASVDFILPKNRPNRPKSRHWSSSRHNDMKKHRSKGPKDKKRRRPRPILMYIVGEALTLQCDGRLLLGISDNEERKITCINNTFESPARSEKKTGTLSSSHTSTQATSAALGESSISTGSVSTNSVKCFNSDTVKLDNKQFPHGSL